MFSVVVLFCCRWFYGLFLTFSSFLLSVALRRIWHFSRASHLSFQSCVLLVISVVCSLVISTERSEWRNLTHHLPYLQRLQRYQFYRMPDFEPAVMPNNHLFCGEIAKFTYICQPARFRPYSLMDRISDSGSDGCGSIPHGGTRRST